MLEWLHIREASSFPMYDEFSPEFYLTKEEYQVKPKGSKDIRQQWKTNETILYILAQMDRLARQHHIYGHVFIVDETMSKPPNAPQHYFEVADDPRVFSLLYSILNHVMEGVQDGTSQYIILVALRLLKVNLNNCITCSVSLEDSFNKAGYSDGGIEMMGRVHDLLFKFISTPPFDNRAILNEAANALTVGFVLFYRQPTDQVKFIMSLLQSGKNTFLLDKLLLQIGIEPQIYCAKILSQKKRKKTRKRKKNLNQLFLQHPRMLKRKIMVYPLTF